MIRPLTKISKDGEVYSRPPGVEENIASAVGLGIEAIKDRLREENPKSENYLKSECLVYLFCDGPGLADSGRGRDNVLQRRF